MKPIAALYTGHDASLTVYCRKRKKFYIYELERTSQQKHHWFHRVQHEDNINALKRILRSLKVNRGIRNDFEYLIYRPCTTPERTRQVLQLFNFDNEIPIQHPDHCSHHGAHITCGYMQSPFDKAFVISSDGGGDNSNFQIAEFNKGIRIKSQNQHYHIASLFTGFLNYIDFIEKTKPLDRAGKIMGLSSYGEVKKEFYPYLDEFSYNKLHGIYPEFKTVLTENLRFIRGDTESNNAKLVSYTMYFDSRRKYWFPKYNEFAQTTEWGKLSAEDAAATIQKYSEDFMVDLIKEKYLSILEKYDNNLVLTGGVGLNVLINQRIREEFPQLNIYVPPNASDSGLSLGLLYNFLIKRNMVKKWSGYDLKFNGAPLEDLHLLKKIPNNIITQDELISKLKSGKIIGFIKGDSEVGPRALGNRSILCDPIYPNMKNIINSKVKFREYYRPFAPMCNIENVSKYFESCSFENMEHMSFVAYVKPEWRSVLKPITHVDNTARLQTVTRESDPIMHSILKDMGRPLLNTSFNVQGKPILNSIKDAIRVLKSTKLDAVVVYHNNQYHYFDIDILRSKKWG